MKTLFTTAVLLLSTLISASAQTPTWQWGKRGGTNTTNTNEYITDIATDPNGNVYVLSNVNYNNGGTLDVAGNALTGRGGTDIVLSSFTCTGAYRWSKVFGSNSIDLAFSVKADTLGGVYVALQTPQTSNITYYLDNDTSLFNNNRRLLLAKYDTSGTYKWSVRPQPDTVALGNKSWTIGLQVDGGGNSSWLCSVSPGSYADGSYNITTQGLNVFKYNGSGIFQGGTKLDATLDISKPYYQSMNFATKGGKFYLAGYMSLSGIGGTLSFGTTNITNAMFIGAFSSTGTSLWTKQNNFTGNGRFLSQITIDNNQNLYIAGAVQPGDAFAGSSAYVNSSSSSAGMNLAMSLDSNGNLRWSKTSSNSSVIAQSHGVYTNGEFVLTGGFTSNVKWSGLNDSVTKVAGGGDYGLYITRFNAFTGQPLAVSKLNSINLTSITPDAAHADRKGNVFFGGRMNQGVVVASDSLKAAGSTPTDFFLAKYGYANCNCIVPVAAITQSNYNNADRSAVFQYTGTTTGIDSIVFNWGNGQRLRLTGNYNGAITRYYGTDTGTYNVCVTVYTNGCGTNTACTTVHFTPLGVGQLSTAGGAIMALAPNPASGVVQVAYSLVGTAGSLEVYDLAGRLLTTKVLRQKTGTETVLLTDLAAGVYVVVLREEGRVMQQQRLVVAK